MALPSSGSTKALVGCMRIICIPVGAGNQPWLVPAMTSTSPLIMSSRKLPVKPTSANTSTEPANIAVSTDVGSSDRKSTRLHTRHVSISYAVFCLKKKKKELTKDVMKLEINLQSRSK